MTWFYVENGEQRGPVTEEELDALVKRGAINLQTLVWREGMENWISYQMARLGAAPPPGGAIPPLGQVLCSECGRAFPPDEVIRHGNHYVCAACKPVFLQKLQEGLAPPVSMNYAGFWIRAGAKILDWLILAVPNALLQGAAFSMMGPSDSPGARLSVVYPLALGLQCAYSTFFVGKFGATPGKMAAKLRVVNADGSPVSYGKAVGRFFAELVSGLICCIGYIMVGFDEEKRGLHDRMCETRVIKK